MKIDVKAAETLSKCGLLSEILNELGSIKPTDDPSTLTKGQADALALSLGSEYDIILNVGGYNNNLEDYNVEITKPYTLSKVAGEWVLNLEEKEPNNTDEATRREQIRHLLSLEAYTKLHENGVLPQFVDSVLSIEESSEATLQHHQKVAIAILLGSEFSVERTYLTLGDTPKVYCDIHALEARSVSQYVNLSVPERPLGISWRLS